MGMMDSSSTAIATSLLRNLVTPIFLYADKSFIYLGEKYKVLEFLRYLILSFVLFFLRFLPSFLHSLSPNFDYVYLLKQQSKADNYLLTSTDGGVGGGESGIARALSQILSIINDVPVSSRKYDVIRSLAERVIEENQREDVQVLLEVNRRCLSAAFERTLSQLESAMNESGRDAVRILPIPCRLNRVLKAVQCVKKGTLGAWVGRGRDGVERSEEKLAAELLWLAQKLVDCGFGEEAVWRWASASNLAWLSLSAEPRMQGSLVKVSAFLLKQAKDLRVEETEEEGKKEEEREAKKNMLTAWLPLLCRGSNGVDAPVLSPTERIELERILERMIGTLELEEDREQVLSLWLHHFSYCPSSDWPNLRSSYETWCSSSRKLLIHQ